MNALPHSVNQLLSKLEKALEGIVILAVAALVIDVLWQVFTGFFSSYVPWLQPSRWTEEFARLLLIWVTMLGAAVAFRRREHLGVDYFVGKLDPNARRLAEIIVELVIIVFAGVTMVYGGYVLVTETLAAGQLTPAMGLKMGHVYTAVPISGLFIVAFGTQRLVELAATPIDASDDDGNVATESNGRESP